MENKKILIVAHPDDEVIFFSSILKEVEKIIICFGESNNSEVSRGRELIRETYPFKNVEWLNIPQSNVFSLADWEKPIITDEGLQVKMNGQKYHENYESLKRIFSNFLTDCSIVYTHNPWGEYGHEEHVSVFNAIFDVIKDTKTEMFVSGYVSDRSNVLFKKRQNLLGNKILSKDVPREICEEIKSLYISKKCWTWHNDYNWPNTEIFSNIRLSENLHTQTNIDCSAFHPAMYLSVNFSQNYIRKLASKILPNRLKKIIKRLLKKKAHK